MNERIGKLAEQAGLLGPSSRVGNSHEATEKFAELIVRECVQACIEEGRTYEVESAGQYQSNLYATAIKKHFGVNDERTNSRTC